ncbi:MAG: right-handed parallel beta-helix repeat-containing protein [bacterium]|nr:right-handed parallel beta-helix repeat-containing protein [bacterium]
METSRLKIVILALLTVVFPASAGATNYYVSPTGSDAADGQTILTPWLSIENGEKTGVLAPGDSIFVLSGSYSRTTGASFPTSGTAVAPIVYTSLGKKRPLIDFGNSGDVAISLVGNHINFKNIAITNGNNSGIEIVGDSIYLFGCQISGFSKQGIRVLGSYNKIVANVVNAVGDRGIENEDSGEFENVFYNNTIYGCGSHGIELHAKIKSSRVFNNIVAANNNDGIRGKVENVYGFNNVWGNLGNDYSDGAVDSAGGISFQPGFVNVLSVRFDLKKNAKEINAGLDIGYPFNGTSPDMGAYEKYNNYFVSPDGNDQNSGRHPDSAWLSIDNGDSTLFPGDTVYVLAGNYSNPVSITDSGTVDEEIFYVGVLDSVTIDGTGNSVTVRISGMCIKWYGIDIASSTTANIEISGSKNRLENCDISNCDLYGLLVTGNENTIQQNRIFGNQNSGLLISGNECIVYNNSFYNNALFGIDALGSTLHQFVNNIISGSATSTGVRADGGSLLSYSILHNLTTPFTGGLSVSSDVTYDDPLFVDAPGSDFNLGSFSPAIDAGVDVGLPYNNSDPDLGAIETGVLAVLQISPVIDSLISDSTYQFDVVALDSSGLPADPGLIVWSHTFSSGVISSGGLFTPDKIGSGVVTVQSLSYPVNGSSAVMTVVPGALSSLSVSPDQDTVSADSTRQFVATGIDIHGNNTGLVGDLTWYVLGDIGTIDSGGLFDAGRVGSGRISVVSSLGASGTSDSIVVTPGALSILSVSPQAAIVVQAESQAFAASGLDSDSNFISDLTDGSVWTTSDPDGSVGGSGTYTAGNIVSSPYYYVKATDGVRSDSAQITVIASGDLTHIRIELADHSVVGDTTLSSDNDSTILYARGYDAGWTLIGDLVVDWTITGVDTIGSLTSSNAPQTNLILTTPGQSVVQATYSGSLTDSTGLITCQPGVASVMTIVPDTMTLTAGETFDFDVVVTDADGNTPGLSLVPAWALLGDIGSMESFGHFSASTVGTGRAVAAAGGLADTSGAINVVAGSLTSLMVVPDSAVIPTDSSLQFSVAGFDLFGNEQSTGNITWSLTSPVGVIDSTGFFVPTSTGITQAIAVSEFGPIDTSAYLEVTPGRLALLTINPDLVNMVTGDSQNFTVSGKDALGYSTAVGGVSWSVTGGIGDITSSGLFTARSIGSGQIVAESSIGGVTDTNSAVVVAAGVPTRLSISPDEIMLALGDSTDFSARAFDEYFNEVSPGELSWSVVGAIGSIDSLGRFQAESAGTGRIAVHSSSFGLYDSTSSVVVEALTVASLPLGDRVVLAGQSDIDILRFQVNNLYSVGKGVEGFRFRMQSTGAGSDAEMLANLDSLHLYRESVSDSLLGSAVVDSDTSLMIFSSLTIPMLDSLTFSVRADVSSFPHDGDFADLLMIPALDVVSSDGSAVAGTDSLNSLGQLLFDGLTRSQITLTPVGLDSIMLTDSMYAIMIIDIPRNGYAGDTLELISVVVDTALGGTVSDQDFDSLVIYSDNGDDIWNGASLEQRLGVLVFTGNRWIRSGLSYELINPLNRLYVAAALSAQPTRGAVVAFGIPLNGIQVTSNNDGPIDYPVGAVDSIVIATSESFAVSVIKGEVQLLVPGELSGALTTIELINNFYDPYQLDSLIFDLEISSIYPETQGIKDSQLDSLLLVVHDISDINQLGSQGTVVSSTFPIDGVAAFDCHNLTLAGAGSPVYLSVQAAVSLESARNGNLVSLSLPDSSRIVLSPSTSIEATYPLQGTLGHQIDRFPLASASAYQMGSQTIFGGQTRLPVFEFRLPGDGYSVDNLRSIRLANRGSLNDGAALTGVSLWYDWEEDGLTANDSLVSTLSYESGEWTVSGVVRTIPSEGSRFIATVDVGNTQFLAGTLEFVLPVGGVTYWSGADGPDDGELGSQESHFLIPTDRVTVISLQGESGEVYPGATIDQLLTFALYNGYAATDTLSIEAITFTNISRSQSGRDWADSSLAQVSLYFDSDHNRLFDESDSLIGTGYFASGQLKMNGLSVSLPPEEISSFFVSAELSLAQIDLDSLAISIEQASDFVFADTGSISVNGDLPLTSGGWNIVNGSVSDQYEMSGLPPTSVTPGDTAVLLMVFRPASNGDRIDTLTSITVENANTTNVASGADISNMNLWMDMNDNALYDSSDSLIGSLSFGASQHWISAALDCEIGRTPPRLLLVADISSGATPNRQFRGKIVTSGCGYRSSNNGPLDQPLLSDRQVTISNAALAISMQNQPERYTVGQTIHHQLTVTNNGLIPLLDVSAYATVSDSLLLTLDSSQIGPVPLVAGVSADFDFYYTALDTGKIVWQFQATADVTGDSSVVLVTDSIEFQRAVSAVPIQFVNSNPTSVTRGQQNVFPLSLTIAHPDTDPISASIRIDSLRIRVEDGSGNGRRADSTLARLVLASGYTNLTILETMPASADLSLIFGEPVVIDPAQQRNFSLLVDIDSAAAAGSFAISIVESSAIVVTDNNSSQPISLAPGLVFPMVTASCRIDNPSANLLLSSEPLLQATVNYGQDDLDLVQLLFTHPGEFGSSPIQVTSMIVNFVDSLLNPISATHLLERLQIRRQQVIVAEVTNFGPMEDSVEVVLNSPLTLNPGEQDSLAIRVSLDDQSLYSNFGLIISDSTRFVVRDLSSHSLIEITTDTSLLATGSVFPIHSGSARLLQPASVGEVCLTTHLPDAVVGGKDSLALVDITLEYPATLGHSSVMIFAADLNVMDSLGRPLNPDRLFDRIGYVVDGQNLTYQPFVGIVNGSAHFTFGSGVRLDPGEQKTISLVGDIEADVPFTNFSVSIPQSEAMDFRDANDTNALPGLVSGASCGGQFPFVTNTADIFLPAGRPLFECRKLPVQVTAPGQEMLKLFEGTLTYDGDGLQGDVSIEGVSGKFVRRLSDGWHTASPGEALTRISVMVDSSLACEDSLLTGDSLQLDFPQPLSISSGEKVTVEIYVSLEDNILLGNYALKFDDSGFIKLIDKNISNDLFAAGNESYPLYSAEISVLEANLGESFVNYPNPFHPSLGEQTTIAYVLPADAHVDIEIFTITGSLVALIADNQFRSQGAHSEDTWTALNDRGLKVISGTYYCRITARYGSGKTEEVRRKVAVIR